MDDFPQGLGIDYPIAHRAGRSPKLICPISLCAVKCTLVRQATAHGDDSSQKHIASDALALIGISTAAVQSAQASKG